MLEKDDLKDLPFYSWQCITLYLSHREVDLVIPDQRDMSYFLRFLIYKLRTVNGQRGSAEPLLDLANQQSLRNHKQRSNMSGYKVSDSIVGNIESQNENQVFRKVYLKYLVMRVRAKISFIALEKRLTVMELLISQILASHYLFKQENGISDIEEYISKLEDSLLENFNHTIPSIMRFLTKS